VDCEVDNVSTKIEWCKNKDGGQGKTWNPVTGCTKISPGCQNCYAERMAKRLRGRCGYDTEKPFKVTLHPDRLEEPLHWRKPSTVFVCSMGDLFHEDVPFDYIDRVFKRINGSPQHDFLILTKRPERMREYFARSMKFLCAACQGTGCSYCLDHGYQNWEMKPYSNVWLGVTAENQEMADERIPILLQIPAAVRFVSVEPMLGPINLRKWLFYQMRCTKCKDTGWVTGLERPCQWCNPGGEFRSSVSPAERFKPKLDWVICGGETGPDARPVHPDWARSLRDQCVSAGVPFFFKQWGEYIHASQTPDNMTNYDPEYFYDREWPPGFARVGKKIAGRLLDGREWNEMPKVAQP
jgi:protein gp37